MARPYAGAGAKVSVSADDFDARRLTEDDLTVTITIWDTDAETVLVNQEPMSFDADLTFTDDRDPGGWYYIWRTPADPAGAYPARITGTGGGLPAYVYTKVRTKAHPIAVS